MIKVQFLAVKWLPKPWKFGCSTMILIPIAIIIYTTASCILYKCTISTYNYIIIYISVFLCPEMAQVIAGGPAMAQTGPGAAPQAILSKQQHSKCTLIYQNADLYIAILKIVNKKKKYV